MLAFITAQVGGDPEAINRAQLEVERIISDTAQRLVKTHNITTAQARKRIHNSALLQAQRYSLNPEVAARARSMYEILNGQRPDQQQQIHRRRRIQTTGRPSGYRTRRRLTEPANRP